jgi:hypothetical protein
MLIQNRFRQASRQEQQGQRAALTMRAALQLVFHQAPTQLQTRSTDSRVKPTTDIDQVLPLHSAPHLPLTADRVQHSGTRSIELSSTTKAYNTARNHSLAHLVRCVNCSPCMSRRKAVEQHANMPTCTECSCCITQTAHCSTHQTYLLQSTRAHNTAYYCRATGEVGAKPSGPRLMQKVSVQNTEHRRKYNSTAGRSLSSLRGP